MAVLARKVKTLMVTKQSFEKEFPSTEVLGLPTNITNDKQVTDAFSQIAGTYGKIIVFVSSTAYMSTNASVLGPQCNLDDWCKTFTTHVLGVVLMTNPFARHAAEGACLLNVLSSLATIPPMEPGLSAYPSSKAATGKVFDYIAL